MDVPAERAAEVYNDIVEGARGLGLLREVKGALYVDLDIAPADAAAASAAALAEDEAQSDDAGAPEQGEDAQARLPAEQVTGTGLLTRPTGRVFITHGRNKEILAQLKDLLTFGGFTPVVAIEQETVSKPVPDKVLDDMRSCAAAIIHVGTDKRLVDAEGKEHKMLNQNVLIEIGAAMALYGRKFILLVEKGATLPSNLQGLYEVRYEGDKLDYDATMKLLKAFSDFRG
jgi:predicted nucleotide-binding protein